MHLLWGQLKAKENNNLYIILNLSFIDAEQIFFFHEWVQAECIELMDPWEYY